MTIIPTELQVIKLRIAIELKKLGLWQESHWYWQVNRRLHPTTERLVLGTTKKRNPKGFLYYSAFTAEEIAFVLPEEIKVKGKHFDCRFFQDFPKTWFGRYSEFSREPNRNTLASSDGDSLVEAMANLLTVLLNKKILKVREVNKEIKSRSVYVKRVFLRAKWARKRIKLGKPIYFLSKKSREAIAANKMKRRI